MGRREKRLAEEKNIASKRVTSFLVLILLILILIICMQIVAPGLARFIKSINGTYSASVADMYYSYEVEPSVASKTTVNPYLLVTVKNYDEDENITKADIKYTIEPVTTDSSTLPDYYWVEVENGVDGATKLAESEKLEDSIDNHSTKEEKVYKVYFKNSATLFAETNNTDISKSISLDLKVYQAD